jgi:hypothetical protein
MVLTALWSPEQQFQHKNGAILTNGKIYVYLAGRTELADIYSDDDGAHQSQNPVILDDNGRAVVFADEAYSYTAVVCDNYGQELFSFRPVGVGASGSASSKEVEIVSNSLSVQKRYDETTDTETFTLEVKNSDCKSWIGRDGQSSVIPADTEVDPLRVPSTNEYDGHFIDRIENNQRIYLKDGLYHVDCVIEFTQESGSEQNKLGQIQVFTGLGNGDESTNLEINETGPLCDDEIRHCIKQSFIRKVKAGSDLASSELYFRPYSPVNLSSCRIKSLSIVELSISGNVGGDYYPGEHVQITESNVINVTGLQPSGDYVEASDLSGYVDHVEMSGYINDINEQFYGVAQELNSLSEAIDEVSGSIPSIDGLASEQYVDQHIEEAVSGKADKSEIPSLEGYATEQYVDEHVTEATSGKADVSAIPSLQGYATESWVDDQGFLKEVPAGYATVDDVDEATSGKMDKSQSGDFYPMASNPSGYLTEHQSLAGYATEQYVQGAVSGKQDTLQFSYDSEDKITSIDGHEIAGTGGGSTYSAGQYVSIQNDIISVTGVQPSGQYLGPNDLSGYVKQDDLSSYATLDYVQWIDNSIYQVLDQKASLDYVQTMDSSTLNRLDGKLDSSAYTAPVNADWSATSGLSKILNKPQASELIPGDGISIVSSGDNYVISTSGSGGSSYQQEVSHDNTLSGNGTPESPLGLSTDLIVIAEEELGTYTVGTSDTNINGTFSKAGYKPIAFTVKFGYSASINFNSEYTKYKSDNSLYIQGYAKVPSGSLSTKFTAIITWMKIS